MTGSLEALSSVQRGLILESRQALFVLDRFINPTVSARLREFGASEGASVLPVGRFVIRLSEDRSRTRARSIGGLVFAHRSRRGWSQAELARRCGMARANLTRLENGRHEPLLSSIKRVASALEVQLSDLISEPSAHPTREDSRWLAAGLKKWGGSLRRMDRDP